MNKSSSFGHTPPHTMPLTVTTCAPALPACALDFSLGRSKQRTSVVELTAKTPDDRRERSASLRWLDAIYRTDLIIWNASADPNPATLPHRREMARSASADRG
jgi:hypothetical protein